MKEKVDILISGGTIVDPKNNLMEQQDLAIRDGKILPLQQACDLQAEQVINARGYLITPGLIDHHVHIFDGGSEYGFFPDSALLPMGVTAAVDAGSAGAANYESFRQNVILRSKMKLFAYLNISSMGQLGGNFPEQINPQYYDLPRIRSMIDKFPEICGLKLRCDKAIIDDWGHVPLQKTLAIARELDTRLVVHGKNPPMPLEAITAQLGAGDILCHCYQGLNSTILEQSGGIKSSIQAARTRGVLFDSADAKGNYDYQVLIPALKEGFVPDIISTDLTLSSLFHPQIYGLPLLLSKYLNLGLPLLEVIRACTEKPARILGLENRLGTLEAGAIADIAMFELKQDVAVVFENKNGDCYNGNQVLVPLMTILEGKIVYRHMETMFRYR
ncbi:amidohydrolase family protein [Propionispora vibrioides]|uniref:Dihydroorotase n=1 Tax=Propionispora vibrioides TaxID=112903 RepID=A0A1H8XW92_9FIRM|nr:amidohydrolase family protein [Propionispora vibrioides]SEP44314.1 dihydroorotase [Propionispora vibrioides]